MTGERAGGGKNPLELDAGNDIGKPAVAEIIALRGDKLFKSRYCDDRADIKGVLERQHNVAGIIDELIDSGNAPRIAGLIRKVGKDFKGGSLTNAPIVRSIRAGLMERVFRKVTKTIEGNPTIDRAALTAEMKALRKSGAIKFLSFGDLRTLRELDTLVEFIPEVVDMGASLQAGQTTEQARGALRLSGDAAKNAISTILEHAGIGRLLTSRIFQRTLLGTGKVKPLEFNKLRVLGAVLAQINRDLEGERAKK